MTVTILAFDTSGPHCAAAVLHIGNQSVARSEPLVRGQGERLFGLLEEVMADARIAWPDLGAIAVGIGPGNFTGVRISVAAARGLALSLGIPAIGITTFEAVALDEPDPCWVVIDARRGEVYAQRMGRDPGAPQLMPDDAADTLDAPVLLADKVDPANIVARMSRIAATRIGTPQPRPAPLYVRPPDAVPAPPR